MSNSIPFAKVVARLDGKERAKLYIKDFHQKKYGNKIGFLSDADERAVLKAPDTASFDEFNGFLHIYTSVPDVALFILDIYMQFMFIYQTLKEAHYRFRLCGALQGVRGFVAGAVVRLVTEEEHQKLIQDSREQTMPIDELIDIETGLTLAKDGKVSELRVDAYEKFNLNKSPLRYDDPEKDAEFKRMFIEERAKQEAKMKEVIASGRLPSDGKVARIADWEKYPDRLDTILTTTLYDYYLVIRGEDPDPITQAWQKNVKKSLEVAVRLFDAISPIDYNGVEPFMAHKIAFKGNLELKATVSVLHKLASDLLTMIHIAYRIKEELGFDPFQIRDDNITTQDRMDAITASIKEHNKIVLEATRDDAKESEAWLMREEKERCYKEVEDMDAYLLADPTIDQELYKKWEKKIFG